MLRLCQLCAHCLYEYEYLNRRLKADVYYLVKQRFYIVYRILFSILIFNTRYKD